MTNRADLEAQLRARPELATLAIYADMLIDEGDPRGDQIASEMRTPERVPLLLRWLASHLQLVPGGDHLTITDERWIPFLDSPIGEFCRGASAQVRMDNARLIVDAIARRRRPFMTRFKLSAGFAGPLVLDARHVAAMPNLTELELDGDFEIHLFRHPRVTKLVRAAFSCNGLESWTRKLDLPACVELVVDPQPWLKAVKPREVTFESLPALRVLDVSSIEPKSIPPREKAWTNLEVFEWLERLPLVSRLERLRVPSVRTRGDAKALRNLSERHPRLEIEVARTYTRCNVEVASDRIRVPAPWPWLPGNMEHDHWTYTLTTPNNVVVKMLSAAIGNGLERVFDHHDEAFREAWRTIWTALDACTATKPQRLPFGLLERGFSGFPVEDIGSATYLRNEILALDLPADQLVTLAPA
jgi:hypothetical protein